MVLVCFKMLVKLYQTTRCYISEDVNIHIYCCENLDFDGLCVHHTGGTALEFCSSALITETVKFKTHWFYIVLEKNQFFIPQWYTVSQETETFDWSSVDQHVSMLCFYKNIRTSNFLGAKHFERRCICNPTVYYVWISVWWMVWVTTNCCFMNNMFTTIFILWWIVI